MKFNVFFISVLLIFTVGGFVMSNAHVPVESSGNNQITNATRIENPTKSWAIYNTMPAGITTQYFEIPIKSGEKLYFSLFFPVRQDQAKFDVSLYLIGSGISGQSVIDHVQIPTNMLAKQIPVNKEVKATYEAFGPSVYKQGAKYENSGLRPGTYFLAVVSNGLSGNYGLAVGYKESFTVLEQILTPVNVIQVYIWEGQNLLFVLMPYLIMLLLGSVLLVRRKFTNSLLGVAALLGFGSTFSFLLQMTYSAVLSALTPEIIISLIFAGLPLIFSIPVFRYSRKEQYSNLNLFTILVLSFIGLFTWAGLILGPVIAITVVVYEMIKSRINVLNNVISSNASKL